MLQREWWTRVRIIQELCLSKNPVLLIGRKEVDWDDFSKQVAEYSDMIAPPARVGKLAFFTQQAWRFLSNIGPDRPLGSNILINSRALIDMRRRTQEGNREGLLELLVRFKNYNSTMERDKVFSLLNIARGSCGVVPNYASSWGDATKPAKEAEIYCHTTLCIIKSYGDLSILGHLDHSGQAIDTARHPSWVSHWNRPKDGVLGHPEVFMDGSLSNKVYGSDGEGTTPYAARRKLTSNKLDRLDVPGTESWAIRRPVIEYDSLVEVADALPPPSILSSLQEALHGIFKNPDAKISFKIQTEHALTLVRLVRIMRCCKALAVSTAAAGSGNPGWFPGFCATLSRGNKTSSLDGLENDWKRIFEPKAGLRSLMAWGAAHMFSSYADPQDNGDQDLRLGFELIVRLRFQSFASLTSVFYPAFGCRLARTGRGIWHWFPMSLVGVILWCCWRQGHLPMSFDQANRIAKWWAGVSCMRSWMALLGTRSSAGKWYLLRYTLTSLCERLDNPFENKT